MIMVVISIAHMAWADDVMLNVNDDGQRIRLKTADVLVVDLSSHLSSGYSWRVAAMDKTVLDQLGENEIIQPPQPGEPEVERLRFSGVSRGRTRLKLELVRPWQPSVPQETFSVVVISLGAYAGAYRVSAPLQAAEVPPEEIQALGLPASFNWCDQGGCTPIKNQGTCGGCWAFATVGVFEAAILIHDGATKDLSEQYLISCNAEGWGCNGGFFAHAYFTDTFIAGENDAGAVYEADFPYRATDVPCNGPHTHYEKLDDWGYVDRSWSVPTVAQLKQAIYDHGPISVAVCAGSAMSRYTGGVFSSHCSSVNHGVVLTGWDDDGGYFHMRNSWGTHWGESGYMRIKYGVSQIGYGATYVDYQGSSQGIAAPSNLEARVTPDLQVDLTWQDNSDNEAAFDIERRVGSGQWLYLASVEADQTYYSDDSVIPGETYAYRAKATSSGGDSAYSDAATVTLPNDSQTVFEDNFETDMGWQVNPAGNDTATTGMWERDDPQGTTAYGTALQLNDTVSGGTCLVTGAPAGLNAGTFDIDGGDTTILSPEIHLPQSAAGITLELNYTLAHLYNSSADDFLRITVISDSDSQVILNESGAGQNRPGRWSRLTASLNGFAGNTIQLVIEAADNGRASLVEAAIDDVRIVLVDPDQGDE
jgi:predicted secreted protein